MTIVNGLSKTGKMLVGFNCVLLIIAALLFVQNHSGWKGDFSPEHISAHAIAEKADIGVAAFNRWNVDPSGEPLVTRLYFYLNLPSFAVSRLLCEVAALGFGEFRTRFPFGMSYTTYIIFPAVLLSMLQWYLIGVVVDKLRFRRTS
jgi:hypothetical protein